MVKVLKTKKKNNATDIGLMVESSTQEEVFEYNEDKIINSLVAEINCPKEIAMEIAQEVSSKIKQLNLENINTSLIRSFVNVVLHEKGFGKELKSNTEIVIPHYDITQLIENATKENGNTTHNPESINLALAERILKEYALKEVFDKDISNAHMEGKIHIHDLGMITRYYCSGHSPEYIKKYGLRNIPTITSTSSPANSAWVLARHICSATQFFTSIFAGAI